MATSAPLLAAASAMARPSLLAAPVMSIVFPASSSPVLFGINGFYDGNETDR
jgi:hypothetical protein